MRRYALMLVCSLGLALPQAHADMIPDFAGAGTAGLKVKSLNELKFAHMIKQQYDFSCGAAALASLLTYHYDYPVTESEVLTEMYEGGDQEKIRKVGFSLLDMKRYLESLGMRADGYRAPLEKLERVRIPALVLINNRGYMHFVIVKGISEGSVLLGDPSSGSRMVNRKEFEKSWNGILFVIHDDKEIARASFNSEDEWQARKHPGAGSGAYGNALNNLTIDASITPNYF